MQKKQALNFLNGLINLINQHFGENTVTVNSSNDEKIKFITKISKELDKGFVDDVWLKEVMRQSQVQLSKVKIEKMEFVPKQNLSFHEYTAIKSFYTGTDFERNSILPMSIPLVAGVLWFTQRICKRMKFFL